MRKGGRFLRSKLNPQHDIAHIKIIGQGDGAGARTFCVGIAERAGNIWDLLVGDVALIVICQPVIRGVGHIILKNIIVLRGTGIRVLIRLNAFCYIIVAVGRRRGQGKAAAVKRKRAVRSPLMTGVVCVDIIVFAVIP